MQKSLFENQSLSVARQPLLQQHDVSRCTLWLGDCLIESDKIESGSVDLILTDLPYGNMNGKGDAFLKKFREKYSWDFAINPISIFKIADRILRKNGKMILFSQEPYSNRLITDSIPNIPFTMKAIWKKDHIANPLGSKKNLLHICEDILIFKKEQCYLAVNPLKNIMKKYVDRYGFDFIFQLMKSEGRYSSELAARVHTDYKFGTGSGKRFDFIGNTMYNYMKNHIDFDETYEDLKKIDDEFKDRYPSVFNLPNGSKMKTNFFEYKKDYDGYHPTQKPIALLEDLIKTFSNENDLVVDLTMGSGSTGVASLKNNRHFIGIEKETKYYDIAVKRCSQYSS